MPRQSYLTHPSPHANWRGEVASGSVPSSGDPCGHGAAVCPAITWPGRALATDGAPMAGSTPPVSWWGSLMERKRDGSGLQYMRNRYYDAATGKFTQVDPVGIAGGVNLYGFAEGDPVNYADPFGLCTMQQRLCHWIEATSMALGSLGGFVVGGGGPALTGVGVVASPFTAAAGGATGAGVGLAAGKAITGILFSEDASGRRGGSGESNTNKLQRRLDEHRQKLEDYRRDPDAFGG